jgi:alkaline phosphatase D
MSGRLTNMHTHDLEPGALIAYNEKCSFGKMVFRSNRPDPEIEFQIVSIDNEITHSHVVKRSEISY